MLGYRDGVTMLTRMCSSSTSSSLRSLAEADWWHKKKIEALTGHFNELEGHVEGNNYVA